MGSEERSKDKLIKPLLKFAAGTTLISLMIAVAALIRGKLAAIILGAAGVGLYGQVDIFYRGLVQICILSTGMGIARCVAELKGAEDTEGVRRAFWSITVFSLGLAITFAVVVMIFSRTLSAWVLGNQQYSVFLTVVAFGLPLQALSDVLMGMLVGLRDLQSQLWITAAYTASGVIVYALLIAHFGLRGAIYSVLAIAGCMCMASIVFLTRRVGRDLRPRIGETWFDVRLLRSILTIGLSGGLLAVTDRIVLLIFRSILIRRFGLEANGLYQSVYSFSLLTTSMTFGFMNAYLMPTLSGLRDSESARREFNTALRLTLLISALSSAIIIIYGRVVLLAAYSSAFLGATSLLRYQAAGDFFRALMLLASTTILALRGWKAWFGIGISFYIAYVALFTFLLPHLGLSAVSISYFLAYGCTCVLGVVLLARYTGMSVFSDHGPLLLRSLLLVLVASGLASVRNLYFSYPMGALTLLLWARFAFSTSECRRVWTYVSAPALLWGGGSD